MPPYASLETVSCGFLLVNHLAYNNSFLLQIEIQQKNGVCPPPNEMAGEIASFLEKRGFLQA